jgi:hypothetical protein
LARNGETSGARNQVAYANALNVVFSEFDPRSQCKTKNERLLETLIQQIDTMSAVASAFSMPAQQNETLNVVE